MKQDELLLIKQAIINEIEGYEFYTMAMNQAQTDEVKDAFKMLADEEKKHVKWLEELFEHIRDAGDKAKMSELDNPPSPRIFNWDKVDRHNAGIAVSVFSIGMQMEEASSKFYEAAAAKTTNERARNLYNILAAWERVHYDMFYKEYTNLQNEWWSMQGYAPF